MGQFHSTASQEEHGNTDEGTKADYYKLLQVEQDATGDEIKKAYRRRALELHPDRNYGNVEAATKLFAEVQSAYEILSDPQERAWYDSHRNMFIGGGGWEEVDYSYNTRMTTSNELFKLFSRFNPRMEFTDSSDGFYGGLREVFARLASEERTACQWDKIEPTDYPTFGFRDDDFEEVVRPFYAAWTAFSTKKSFAWKDVYRYSEAPDRRVRRLMEKENKARREEAIREFNGAVRSLVAFAKKRDRRYKSNIQSELQRQQVLRQSAAAQAARSRASNLANLRDHVVQDWAQSEDLQEDESDISANEMEHFVCVVCNKQFKSQNQFGAHERSKKHLKAIKQLRWEMRAQDKQLHLEGIYDHEKRFHAKGAAHTNPTSAISTNASLYEPQPVDEPLSNSASSNIEDGLESSFGKHIGITESRNEFHGHTSSSGDCLSSDNTNYTSRKSVQNRLHVERENELNGSIKILPQIFEDIGIEDSPQSNRRTPGKAKQKRAKKAQRLMDQTQSIKCATCNSAFPSKTQLFSHIRELDHAQPLPITHGHKRNKQ